MVVFKICNKCSPLGNIILFHRAYVQKAGHHENFCCSSLTVGGRRGQRFRYGGVWPKTPSSKHWSLNLQGASRDTHLHPRVTLVRQKSGSTAPWVSQTATFLRWTFSFIRGPWHLCCCCNIVQPLAINPIPNRLLLYTKKTWVFGKSYVVHVFHVYFGKSICSKFMKSEAVSLIFTKSIEIHCRVSFHLLPGGAIAASMAKKGGASITFPVFLASLMSGCFGRKVTHDP